VTRTENPQIVSTNLEREIQISLAVVNNSGRSSPVFFECVGNVFGEDEAQDDMLILSSVQVAAEFVCRLPEMVPESLSCPVVAVTRHIPSPSRKVLINNRSTTQKPPSQSIAQSK